MKKNVILFIFLILINYLYSINIDSLYVTSKNGILVEKGETLFRSLFYTGFDISLLTNTDFGIIDYGVGYKTGSLLGSISSYNLFGNISLNKQGQYNPSAGLVMDLELGDYIFYSNGSSDMPSDTGVYLGLNLKPLRFSFPGYYISFLEIEYQIGLNINSLLRSKINLLSISNNILYDHSLKNQFYVEVATDVNLGLLENQWLSTLQVPGIRGNLSYKYLTLGLFYQNMISNLSEEIHTEFFGDQEFRGYRLGADLSLQKNSGSWNPSVGIGYYYSDHTYLSYFGDSLSHGTYGIVKPLKYNLTLNPTLSLVFSFLEFKFGPLLPNSIKGFSEAGNFLLQISPIVVGIKFKVGNR